MQSGIINDEITPARLPGHPAVRGGRDICASGGYCGGGRRPHLNQVSIVGSIGVLMDGFGFTGLMDKVGVGAVC